jgi:hypothetical protein
MYVYIYSTFTHVYMYVTYTYIYSVQTCIYIYKAIYMCIQYTYQDKQISLLGNQLVG